MSSHHAPTNEDDSTTEQYIGLHAIRRQTLTSREAPASMDKAVASKYAAGWRIGDVFTGDPPGELQGAFSVYDTDASTLEMLSRYGLQL